MAILADKSKERGLNSRAKPDLKPTPTTDVASPVITSHIKRSYVSEATRQLSQLSYAVGQDDMTREKLLRALDFSAGDWAQDPVPAQLDRSAWVSDVSNDHSPVEYSLALDQRTGDVEVRFLIEAQPKLNNLTSLQASVSQLSEDIALEYSETVSLHALDTIRDLFMPQSPEGTLVAWHSFAMSKTLEKWKIYLNPQASGKSNASRITSEAMARLGLGKSWSLLENIMSPDDYVIYCALGLSRDPENAEVKVYVAHPGASATQIAQKHLAIDPSIDSTCEMQRFYHCMAGGSLGPYHGKPAISCFAFKRENPLKVTRTALFPMDSYVAHDAEAQERVEAYMQAISAPPAYRERYFKAIDAVRRRSLDSGRGIHSWVSLKMKPDGKRSNTFYLSPELYGPLVDDGVASDNNWQQGKIGS